MGLTMYFALPVASLRFVSRRRATNSQAIGDLGSEDLPCSWAGCLQPAAGQPAERPAVERASVSNPRSIWIRHPQLSMSEYAVARLEDIDEISDGREPWRPVRHHFGITSFGINAWTGRETGDRIINEHDEEGEDEEVYFVHSGRALFELDGERLDAPAGTFVFARPGVKRTAFAEEPQTTILAVGGTPGRVYQPTGWELWAPVGRLYQEGRYAEAADQARDLAAAHPEYPALLYNLACCESLAGRKADAIEHLRLAIETSDSVRSYLAGDSDLDPLREEPEFQALLAG
jgi:mannose-6-phosphate isomerase-like protein (cupin superfamily)